MDRRRLEESIFKALMVISTFIIVASLASIMFTVFFKGLPSLNLSMIFQTPKGGYYLGKGGGIANAIVGSLYLAGGASVLAIFISLPVAIHLNVYARRDSKLVSLCRFSFDVLNGIPSIVYGAIGFTLMIFMGLRTSLLAGIITVALLILPIMIRSMDEVIRTVPRDLLDAAYALGANRWETSMTVVLRQALPGILTAILIAFGRAMGDAASVLFTAGFTDNIPDSLLHPAATLPLAIFFQLGSPLPEVQNRAYASALILTVIILVISVGSRWLSKRLTRHIIR
jgi:phosphate transport system permease protein